MFFINLRLQTMKKILLIFKPLTIATLSLLIVSLFLRYYLYINSAQLIREFKNQNYRELYALDTMKISSRLNSLSMAINWICIEGQVGNVSFYKMSKGKCQTNFFQQHHELSIPHANNMKIAFTLRLPKEVEVFFSLFLVLQVFLIFVLIYATKKSEEEKRLNEIQLSKLARQMSHDIRSPIATLNTIIFSIENLSENDRTLLTNAIVRINNIANHLLIDSKNNNFLSQDIPINKMVNISEELKNILVQKRLEYSNNSLVKIADINSSDDLYATIDAVEFHRIISNLINNSIEARKPNNPVHITINIFNLNDEIEILIKDNGKGIPETLIAKLGLDEFTTKKTGNGLGLVHCYETIKQWEGSISINSEINTGTAVRIFLPKVTIKKEITILIDDDELVRLTWDSMAKKCNLNFIAVATYEELKVILNEIENNSPIYIDSQLSNGIKGELIAQELYEQGFTNLFITSGFNKEQFKNLPFLNGIKDKSPPWRVKI